jgi:hypothetical protein
MTIGETVAIIGGSGGLSAALNFLITQWSTRTARSRDVAHQTLLVIEHLENYAFGCAGHAFGDWAILVEGRPGALLSQPPHFPPFSDQIDWKALDSGHAASVRAVASNVELALAASAAGFGRSQKEGYGTALFWTLRLGTEALEQATFLRRFADMPPLVLEPPRWDYPAFLKGEIEKIELRKSQMAATLS